MEVAGVHVRAWQVGYRGVLPDEYLESLRPEQRAGHYTFGDAEAGNPVTIVAVDQGAICGFATTALSRDVDAQGAGELWALYVEPSRWGRGIGQLLMTAARQEFARLGLTSAILWVLVGNKRAASFYRSDGWGPDGSRRHAEVWGTTVEEVRYRRVIA
jgi:GNAT superfamily N-acetyltransferase